MMLVTGLTMAAKTVDEYLDAVNYKDINENYIATPFAYKYVQFIKNIVNDGRGDSHPSPAVHLVMLDQLSGSGSHFANLASRGLSKTSVFAEYLFLYIACFGEIDGFGELDGALYVGDSMENGAANLRKNIETRYNNSENLKRFVPRATFTDKYIEFENAAGHKFAIKLFGAKTGLRGTKIFGKRPVLAILDDLVSDDDAKSKVAMERIKDTVYSSVGHALDPTRKKIIFNGTPFNKNDVLYEAVESGAWTVNVFPICERFPCTREEFHGAWEERFTYDYIAHEYALALKNGNLKSFNRELMLRITSEQERLVSESQISMYNLYRVMSNISAYNVYITTDFATSKNNRADWSVISVWAYDFNGNWFLIDGYCGKSEMDVNINELFRLVQKHNPQSVGIETSGQQKGFVSWVKKEQLERGIFFPFASNQNSMEGGIRPVSDKMTRFSMVLPLFAMGKIHFPLELLNEPIMVEMLEELRLASESGFKSKHDDCIDTISMLGLMNAFKPSMVGGEYYDSDSNSWKMSSVDDERDDFDDEHYHSLSRYIV